MKKDTIGYLGPEGTWSGQAAKMFAEQEGLDARFYPIETPKNSFSPIFESVSKGRMDYGVIPIWNLIMEDVKPALEGLNGVGNVSICRKVVIPIVHCIGVLPGSGKVKDIRSKAEALSQCEQTLFEMYPKVPHVATSSTAQAVSEVYEKKAKGIAVVAPYDALVSKDFKVLDQDIGDEKLNKTIFAVLSKSDAQYEHDRQYETSMILNPGNDVPGLLHNALSSFSDLGVNLTKVHSMKDGKGLPIKYRFHIDAQGHRDQEPLKSAISNLEAKVELRFKGSLKVLGSYPTDYLAGLNGVH